MNQSGGGFFERLRANIFGKIESPQSLATSLKGKLKYLEERINSLPEDFSIKDCSQINLDDYSDTLDPIFLVEGLTEGEPSPAVTEAQIIFELRTINKTIKEYCHGFKKLQSSRIMEFLQEFLEEFHSSQMRNVGEILSKLILKIESISNKQN